MKTEGRSRVPGQAFTLGDELRSIDEEIATAEDFVYWLDPPLNHEIRAKLGTLILLRGQLVEANADIGGNDGPDSERPPRRSWWRACHAALFGA